ncbi:MAG: hypothetical protein ACK4NP_14005 [Parvularculaceae bacterium]
MGRLVLFLVVVAAALAGIWFYAPGGKDILLGAKSQVMGMLPGGADDAAADADDAAVEVVEEAEEVVEEPAEEASAEEPQ